MANNVNNGITGVIDIPGALRSRGAADGNQVGGVVAYAGDIYDTTFGKNQSQINQEFSDSLSSSENANTSRPIKLYLTGNNSEYSVNINYAEGAYEEGLGPVFAATCVDEYLLDSDTLEQVAQITNITSSEGTITITTDNNLGQLEDALYVLQSVEGTGSVCSGSFVDKSENGVIYGNAIFNSEDSEESVLVGSVMSNDGSYSTVVGGANFNSGNDSTIIGNDNTNASEKNTIIGYGNSSSESRSSVLIGHNLSLTDGVGVRLGNYNVEISPNNYFAVSGRMNRVNQNILEQHTDGSLYIKGLGGFNGTNSTTTGIKSLQDVISDIESNSSSSSSSYTHPSTHPASMITYSSSETYSSGNVGYEIKQLTTQLASKYTKPNNGIPSSDLDSSVQTILGYASDYNSNKQMYVKGVYKGSTNLVNGYGVAEIPDDSILVKNSSDSGYSIKNAGSNAFGHLSLSLGYQTIAKGDRSVAEGSKIIAYGNNSHAEGDGPGTTVKTTADYTSGSTTIYLNGSVDEGVVLVYGNDCVVVDSCSESGSGVFETTIDPSFSTSILSDATIRKYTGPVGFASHTEGSGTIATGSFGHAEGLNTRAYGTGSHAEGDNTVANNGAEHAEGKYNVSHSSTISSIGIGTSSSDRKNAFEVLGNGNIYVKGLGNYDGTSIANVDSLQTVITDVNTRLSDLKSAVQIGDNIVIATSPRSEFYSTNKGAEDNVIIGTASIEYTYLYDIGSFKKNIIVGDGNKLNNCDRTAVSSSVIFGSNNNVTGGVCIGVGNTNQSTSDKRQVFTLLGIRLTAGDSNNITYNYNFVPYATVIGFNNNPTTFNGIYSSYQNGDWTDAGAFEVGAGKHNTSVSILAQKSDGNLYIKGVGGWDGMSSVKNKKSINTIISEFETRIAALESQIAALTNN